MLSRPPRSTHIATIVPYTTLFRYPALPPSEWEAADGEFIPASDDDGGGRWYYNKHVPAQGWPLAWRETHFTAQCRSEEHTSELQSLMRLSYAVFCLKKNSSRSAHTAHRHKQNGTATDWKNTH